MKTHKAQYSSQIVEKIREILLCRYDNYWDRPKVWDPYAGPGLKLKEIVGDDFDYGGTELEESFIQNPRIQQGNATDPDTYPRRRFVICTSPVYANGIADNWAAQNESTYNTYRSWIKQIEGEDRELHHDNMGRYGYRGTRRDGRSAKRINYWQLAQRTIDCWYQAELVILNVSDFLSGGEIEPHAEDWKNTMLAYGWVLEEDHRIVTGRLKFGQNRDERAPFENVFVFSRNP